QISALSLHDALPIYEDMNRVVAALHSVDYVAVGLADYGRPGNFMHRQVGRWSQQYRASETEPVEAMDRLMEWLPAHIPADDSTRSEEHTSELQSREK